MAFDNKPNLNKTFVRPLHLDELIAMYGAGETKDVLIAVKADLVARINDGHEALEDGIESMTEFVARTIVDGKCDGAGTYSKKDDTQNEDDANIRIPCNGCGSWGYVTDSNTVIKTWTNVEPVKTEA